jgi:hypothetical protein
MRALLPGTISTCNQKDFDFDSRSDSIQFGISAIDSVLPSQGLQRGALHEFFYDDPLDRGATASTLPALLAYNSHSLLASRMRASTWNTRHNTTLPRTLWIGKRSWPSPPALAALSASDHALSESFFSHSLFIDPPNDTTTLWAIDLALRSAAVDLIVAACPSISRTTTQRLSLAAQKHNTTALLLRSTSDRVIPSCAASRWSLSPTPSTREAPAWRLSLLKLRGGLLLQGEWVMHLSAPDLFAGQLPPLTAMQVTTQSSEDLYGLEHAAREPLYRRAQS